MSFRSKVFRIVIPVIILIAGFVVMRLLVLSRPAPQKEIRSNPGALVEVLTVSRKDHQVQVIGTGTVQARREASITPRVSGRITYIAPAFIAGGFFSSGDLLFEIEAVDYQLAVVRARAVQAQAELELAKVESSALIARREWEGLATDSLATNKNEKPNPLVLYEPQIKKARADVAAAGAVLKQAELDLQRTRIYAPFDCRVRSEGVEAGQYVRAGSSVAVVAGTETAEIVVPLSLEDLQWLRIPRQGSEAKGSPAKVRISVGKKSFSWQGRVVRSLGEVDPKGRMARVVVAVDDPYYLKTRRNNDEPDLEMGMFVEVTFSGEILTGVVPVPASALRENNTVWVVNKEDRLNIRPVTVVRREQQRVIISDGLKEGERLVLTSISGAAEGMKLRLLDEGEGR
ncbi:MAG: efflux RND transporter periplasmic adaptor subunit [Nitrospirae bacterium]|nr:efflux RND transporter periplasmic adaptor subunit [Nitrospirota bacterium]